MALRLVNLHKQEEFRPSADPDRDNDELATKFFHRPLDAYEQAYLQDRISTIEKLPAGMQSMSPQEVMANATTRTEVHRVAVECVRLACTGFENLLDDETGQPIEYETELVNIAGKTAPRLKLDIVRRIPVATCMEFWQDVMAKSTVSKSAEKNSGKASSPSNSSKTGAAKAAPTNSASSEATTASPN